MTRLLLASASPRRRELLALAGYAFDVVATDVPEVAAPGETPGDYGRRVALAKARAGFAAANDPAAVVLGADTEVVLDGAIFGKPHDRADVVRMLRLLSGRCHEVPTALAVACAAGEATVLQCSRVRFRALAEAELQAYAVTAEPLGKAGGYAIQGFAAVFIEHLEGSYSGVMGLPLCETAALLARFGVRPGWSQPSG